MGEMGSHFKGKNVEIRLIPVRVDKYGDSLMGITVHQLSTLKNFDAKKQKKGFLGYWASMVVPGPPEDYRQLFPKASKKEGEGE